MFNFVQLAKKLQKNVKKAENKEKLVTFLHKYALVVQNSDKNQPTTQKPDTVGVVSGQTLGALASQVGESPTPKAMTTQITAPKAVKMPSTTEKPIMAGILAEDHPGETQSINGNRAVAGADAPSKMTAFPKVMGEVADTAAQSTVELSSLPPDLLHMSRMTNPFDGNAKLYAGGKLRSTPTPPPQVLTPSPSPVNSAQNPSRPKLSPGLEGYVTPQYTASGIDTVKNDRFDSRSYIATRESNGGESPYNMENFKGVITPRAVLNNTYGDQLDKNVAEASAYNKKNNPHNEIEKNIDKPVHLFESDKDVTSYSPAFASNSASPRNEGIININPIRKDRDAFTLQKNHMAQISPNNKSLSTTTDPEMVQNPWNSLRHEAAHAMYPAQNLIRMEDKDSALSNNALRSALNTQNPEIVKTMPAHTEVMTRGYFADAGERATGISTAQQDMFRLTGNRAKTPEQFQAFINKYLSSPNIEKSMQELSPNTRRYIRFHVGMPEEQKWKFMQSDAHVAPGFVQNQQQPMGQKIASCRSTGVFDCDGNEYVNGDDVELLGKLGFILAISEYGKLEKTSEVYDQYSYIEKIAGIPKAVVKAVDKGDAFSGEFLKDMDYDVPKGYEMKGDLCCPVEKKADDAAPSNTTWSSELLNELTSRIAKDQSFRSGNAISTNNTVSGQDIDKSNIAWLKPHLDKFGLPTGQPGKDVALLVQHADFDPDFQETVLQKMRTHNQSNPGSYGGETVAHLDDRINVNRGRPQMYGSQGGEIFENGKWTWKPKEIFESHNLENRRKEMGLIPHKEYTDLINKHFVSKLPLPAQQPPTQNTLTPNTTPNLSTKIQPTPIGVNQDVSNIYGAGDTPYGEKPVKNPFPGIAGDVGVNVLEFLAARGARRAQNNNIEAALSKGVLGGPYGPPVPPGSGGTPIPGSSLIGKARMWGNVANGVPLFGAGTQLQGANDRRKDGDYTGMLIDGVGALGSAAQLHPLTKGIGLGVSTASTGVNIARDVHRYNNRPVEFSRNPENVKLNAPENPVQIPQTLAKAGNVSKEAKGRCWEGYKPVKGKKPYSADSCEPVAKEIEKEAGMPDWLRRAIRNNDKSTLSSAGKAGARARAKNLAAKKSKDELRRMLDMGAEAVPKIIHPPSAYNVQPPLPGI